MVGSRTGPKGDRPNVTSARGREGTNTLSVPVQLLEPGLHVAEIDRPWSETPFLFQGFRIADLDDLEQVRAHCKLVEIDLDKSEPAPADRLREAMRKMQGDLESDTAGARSEHSFARRRASSIDTFADRRRPDDSRFRQRIRTTNACRTELRHALDEILADARMGRSLDTRMARDAVQRLSDVVSESATAALWLLNLKQQDQYTEIHSLNVCILTLAFGHFMALDEDYLAAIGVGALLHDIGKTRTPREILTKPGALTPEEFEIMKKHARDGYEMMAASGHLSSVSLEIILSHHERALGQGYPYGLKRDQIPYHAMLTAIADTYDAMTSNRIYHEAAPCDEVLQALYKNASEDFTEKEVVEFIRCLGIFPPGSVVRLDDGSVAMVVSTSPKARLQPVVLMLRSPDGESYRERALVNLAVTEPGGTMTGPRRISHAIDPNSIGISVPDLVSREFNLEPA